MKILKIEATGLKLFKGTFEVDFYAKQRVSADKNEMLTNIKSNLYINNVLSLVGINASGKTSTLKVLLFVMQLLECKPINTIDYNTILEGISDEDEVEFNIYFVTNNGKISKLNTVIKQDLSKLDMNSKYYISNETIYTKSLSTVRSKQLLFDFTEVDSELERKNDELFLLDDVSIMIAYNKKHKVSLNVFDAMEWTDLNSIRVLGSFPLTLVHFLDPSIEYLNCEIDKESKKIKIFLKFYNHEEYILNSPLELNHYLSSGTLKGLNIFMTAMMALTEGGYFIIDELENHFNKEIVSTLIKFFMDSELNKKGAVLVFTTHYVELLDIFERNDNIYLIKNIDRIQIENLSDVLNRNDVKKSDLFQSGYLEYTTPDYDAYIALKHTIARISEEVQDGER